LVTFKVIAGSGFAITKVASCMFFSTFCCCCSASTTKLLYSTFWYSFQPRVPNAKRIAALAAYLINAGVFLLFSLVGKTGAIVSNCFN